MKNTNNIEALLSKERLTSYSSIEEHFLNLKLIGQITPKLATLEIIIRNSLDILLIKDDPEWLRNYKDENIQSEINKLQTKNATDLTHHQLLSRMSLGKIIRIIQHSKQADKIFNLKSINFKEYSNTNKKDFLFINGNKVRFSNLDKALVSMNLILTLRNRSYHWENILKTQKNKNDVISPRITTEIRKATDKAIIGILPNKIELFLTDIIKTFSPELMKYCE